MKGNPKKNSMVKTVTDWIEYRLPIFSMSKHLGEYEVPKNLNYAWNFGSLAGLALIIQIVTGLFLAMQYTPHVDYAFDSVERIMRDVNYGWLIRYLHAVGASMFFVVMYLHIARGLFYGSYKKPRELMWFIGIVLFLAAMATAFMGYVLPWGQMSFWGAKVITNLFSAVPIIGEDLVIWLWGGFSVGNPTLNRFYALHFLLPFVILGIVIIHVWAVHIHGSSNPSGVEVKTKQDTIPFHPYYTFKDLYGIGIFLIIYLYFVFFAPNSLGDADNYIPANPMVTPIHIVPEWYFLPFYAILRSIPSKLGGVLAMFGAIMILFALPWLDKSETRSGHYRPMFKIFLAIFIVVFIALGYIGGQPPEEPYLSIGRICTVWYFAHFLLILPLITKYEVIKSHPNSISEYFERK